MKKWTKSCEKMPPDPEILDVNNDYLGTTSTGRVIPLKYIKKIVRKKEVIRWEYFGKICRLNIVAWKPFPRPYKERVKKNKEML